MKVCDVIDALLNSVNDPNSECQIMLQDKDDVQWIVEINEIIAPRKGHSREKIAMIVGTFNHPNA